MLFFAPPNPGSGRNPSLEYRSQKSERPNSEPALPAAIVARRDGPLKPVLACARCRLRGDRSPSSLRRLIVAVNGWAIAERRTANGERANEPNRARARERLVPNPEPRTPNPELRTPNPELQTPNSVFNYHSVRLETWLLASFWERLRTRGKDLLMRKEQHFPQAAAKGSVWLKGPPIPRVRPRILQSRPRESRIGREVFSGREVLEGPLPNPGRRYR